MRAVVRRTRRPAVFTAWSTFAAAAVCAQMPPSARTALEAYRTAIAAAQSRPTSAAIEAAFSALGPVSEALTHAQDSGAAVLESLSEDEFARVRQQLAGALVNRDETIFVEADPDYFTALAGRGGAPADRRFFAALKATYPGGVWPVYLQQQTDYSGCTDFGSGTLVQTYRRWSGFQKTFPDRYGAAAQKHIDQVSEHITQSTCACGDTASVQQELRRFLQSFPASPIRSKVSERLQALQNGRSDIRTHCASG